MRMALAAAAAWLLTSCVVAEPVPTLTGPNPNAKALQFQLPKWPDGPAYDIASDRGNVVVLDVWASWCEPCRDALPTWEQVAKEYAGRGLKVYAINVDQDPNQVRRFLEEVKFELPILRDEGATVSETVLKVRGMPTTFFVDRRGVVRFVHEGFAEEHLNKYQSQLEELLNEKP